MKTPFSNFFKKVLKKKEMQSEPINKPVEEIMDEKRNQFRIPRKKRSFKRARRTIYNRTYCIQREGILKVKRSRSRAKMQKISRIINRKAA